LNTGANVHVCDGIFMFSSYQVTKDSSVLMRNGSHVVATIDLKFTSEKDHTTGEHASCPYYQQESHEWFGPMQGRI
jgi:hypothetical protein